MRHHRPEECLRDHRLPDAVAEYLADPRRNRTPDTIDAMTRHLAHLTAFLAGQKPVPTRLDDVRPYHIAAWLDLAATEPIHRHQQATRKPATLNLMRTHASGLFRWAIGRSYTHVNPVLCVDGQPVGQARDRVPIRGVPALLDLLAGLADEYAARVGLLAVTGLRSGEANALRWRDWDSRLHVIHVPRQGAELTNPATTKRHERSIPVSRHARVFLMRLAAINGSGPYIIGVKGGTERIRSRLSHVLRPLRLWPHALRAWCRTSLESIHPWVPPGLIDDWLGQSTAKVRAAYTPADNPEALRHVADELDAWLVAGGSTLIPTPTPPIASHDPPCSAQDPALAETRSVDQ